MIASSLVAVGSQRRLVARWPCRHYGHQALGFLEALLTAKSHGAELYYLRPWTVASPRLFDIQPVQVPTRWANRWVWGRVRLQPSPIYYPRRLFRQRLPLPLMRLPNRAVAIHVREGGYKFGHEVQDVKTHGRDDACRNAHIGSYRGVGQRLAEQGFTVVRLGDPTMTPIAWPRDIDLAVGRTDARLELAVLLGASFLIATESGPCAAAYLTNTPTLTTNATDPVGSYPIRSDGVLLLKHVYDRCTGKELSLRQLCSVEYLDNVRQSARYRYGDNTPTELQMAVDELQQVLQHRPDLTPEQTAVRARLVASAAESQSGYLRKWGPDQGFLGDGRLVQFQAAQL